MATEELVVLLDAKTQGLDAKVKASDAHLKKFGITVDSVDKSIGKVDKSQKELTTKINKTTDAVRKATTQTKEMDSRLKGAGRSAGAAGIQIQQFVGQVQGGQSPMLALSQQAADLGIVLGAPLLGSIAGLSAGLAGALIPNLFSAESALESMMDAAEKLNPVLTTTENGTQRLADELLELAGLSETLAKVKITDGIKDAESVISAATDGIVESMEQLPQQTRKFIGDLSVAFNETGGDAKEFSETLKDSLSIQGVPIARVADLRQVIRELSTEFNINASQASELAVALGNVQNNADPMSVQTLSNVLEDLNESTGFGNEKLIGFTNNLIPFIQQTSQSVDQITALNIAMSDIGKAKQGGELGGPITDFALTEDEFNESISLFTEQSETFNSLAMQIQTDGAQAEIDLNQWKLDRIYEQGVEAAKRKEAFEKQMQKLEELRSIGGAKKMISALGAINEQFFNDNKALNQGLIVADTAATVMAEYKRGSVPAAIAAGLTGAAQLASLNSSSIGGGTTASIAATATPQTQGESSATESTVSITDAATEQVQIVRVEFEGLESFVEGVTLKQKEMENDGVL